MENAVDREKVISKLEELLEYSRYNDSVGWNPDNDTKTLEDALALLKAQEPVVRCRDCRYCFSADSDPLTPYDGESTWYCDRFDFDVDVLALDPCRFYCADGERRDEDADN